MLPTYPHPLSFSLCLCLSFPFPFPLLPRVTTRPDSSSAIFPRLTLYSSSSLFRDFSSRHVSSANESGIELHSHTHVLVVVWGVRQCPIT
uniref:Putative secreted protein n=1 Tax=Anopheles darlingi TaxID=43151 RepID=A0A2M4D288_ANODA